MARLRRLHPFVAATLKAAETRRPDASGRVRIPPTAGLIPLSISPRQLRRAALVLHAFFGLAQTRGYDIVAAESEWGVLRGVAIEIRGHRYPVRIAEGTSSIPRNEGERKHVANGTLKLIFSTFEQGARTSWSEGPRGTLQSKFSKILDELEARAERDDLQDLLRAKDERERQRLLAERLEQQRRQRVEEGRRKRLSAEVQAWRHANEVRDYVAALRKRAVALSDPERERIEAWCDWAEQLAAESDPLWNIETIAGLDGDEPEPR